MKPFAPLLAVSLVAAAVALVGAQIEMPDIKQMSGIPRPVDDLPDAVISVRLVKGQLSNNITNHPVELHGPDGKVWTAKTDEAGRAQFAGIPGGTTVHAVATVDGERLESQEFPVPPRGGIRLMLVASADATAGSGVTPPAVPQPGTVVLGGESRIVLETTEDAVQVFYLFEIMNTARVPVALPSALVFDMPSGAEGTTVMQTSTIQANSKGERVTVPGPFPPGRSQLEVAYVLPYSGPDVTLTQKLPAALNQLAVVAQKATSDMSLSSPQLGSQREMPAEGHTYIMAVGQGLPAGGSFTLAVSGLPHRSATPRYVALALATLVMVVGAWAALTPGDKAFAPRRKKLLARRDTLFAALVKIEEQRRAGTLDQIRYVARRRELIVQLERVYGELDEGLAA